MGAISRVEGHLPTRRPFRLTDAAPWAIGDPYDDPAVEDGPWFFAWVNPNEATFVEAAHARVDEWIFSVNIEHKEGDNPTATLEIENPGVGLLASGRLSWMWISKRKVDTTIVPLFFGQLLAIPSDLLQTVITITLVARSVDQDSRKLALAQTLKVPPYFDEIWVDLASQTDPEAVLEGYSSRWHFDRITQEVTISDVLEGEDGTLEFGYDDLFWDGMNLTIDNIPLSSVSVRATINWTQKAIGTIDLGGRNIVSFTGDGHISDWPKPYTSLGGGWSTGETKVLDAHNTGGSDTASYSANWQSRNKNHRNGDMISSSNNETYPVALGPLNVSNLGQVYVTAMSRSITVGFPHLESNMGTFGGFPSSSTDYPGSAASASLSVTYLYVQLYNVSATMELRYDASRERKEIINFTMVADTQDILLPAGDKKAKSDRLSVNGRNVGNPLHVRAILHGIGGNVSDGDQVLILSDPPYRFQATLTAGEGHVHIGATLEESLTNLTNAINGNGLGEPGVDYAVENSANETVFASELDASSILLIGLSVDDKILVATTSSVLEFDATSTYTWVGGNPTNGSTATVAGVVYTFDETLKVLLAELTLTQTIGAQLPYHVLIDANSAEGTLVNFAAAINADGGVGTAYSTGTLQNLLAQAEVLNGVLTVFPRHADANLVMAGPWTLSTDHLIPDQGTVPIGDVSRRSYFDTDRGQQSIQALICRARAKLRISTRAVKATFVTELEKGFGLSCRKNAILNDPRFAGGQAMGKVISYYFKASGDDGTEISGGEVGCAVGNGNAVLDDPGTPAYVDTGYADPGWQMYVDQQVHLGINDVWYTPPVDTLPQDDGLVFPLTVAQGVLANRMIPRPVDQKEALDQAFQGARPNLSDPDIFASPFMSPEFGMIWGKDFSSKLAASLRESSMIYELVLAPLDGGPYSTRYEVNLSELMIPKQVDLGAE